MKRRAVHLVGATRPVDLESATPRRARCLWCGGKLPAGCRSDTKFCSQSHRQAHHRFGGGAIPCPPASSPRRFTYADPPYPKLARKYYGKHPDFAGEVDHRRLLSRLQKERLAGQLDGFALSTKSDALPMVLAICERLGIADVKVGAWHCGGRHGKSYYPRDAWQPVVYAGARRILSRRPRFNSLVYRSAARRTDPKRVTGAKPAAFCYWLFDLLGARPGDELVDLVPGSGGVMRAWTIYNRRSSTSDVSTVRRRKCA